MLLDGILRLRRLYIFLLTSHGTHRGLHRYRNRTFCGATFLVQPLLGNLSDRIEALTWKRMVLALTGIYFLVCVAMIAIPHQLANIFLLGLLYFIANLIAPFINSAHYHYSSRGIYINFGVARGPDRLPLRYWPSLSVAFPISMGHESSQYLVQVHPRCSS